MHPDPRAGPASARFDTGAVRLEHLCEPLRRRDRSIRGLPHALKEKGEPFLPIALAPHAIEQLVVPRAMLFQIQAQIEQRVAQHPRVAQE